MLAEVPSMIECRVASGANVFVTLLDVKLQGPYLKRFLKKLILEIESDGGDVLDELYEHYAFYVTSLQDNDVAKGNSKLLKSISFLFSDESAGLISCPNSRTLEVQLQCSLNMLEGDTGCSLWPSSMFLSEFILSFPEIFANKCCFEIGSGVGLVGICIAHVKASKVILSDGDLSTLANMKVNLELNHLSTSSCTIDDHVDHSMVQCVCLSWESASKDDLLRFAPDIILGADVIYDPSCLPHLVRVLTTLLRPNSSSHNERRSKHSLQEKVTSTGSPVSVILGHPSANGPIAFVASVIRNIKTFDYFLALAREADLIVMDITEKCVTSGLITHLGGNMREQSGQKSGGISVTAGHHPSAPPSCRRQIGWFLRYCCHFPASCFLTYQEGS